MEEKKNPKMNPYIYGQMIFSKVSKTIQWEKHCFQTFVYGKLDTKLQKNKGRSLHHLKSNWKWSKDLKVGA